MVDQDWKDIDFGIEKKVYFLALSFVRKLKMLKM
jgi:pyruvate kinase